MKRPSLSSENSILRANAPVIESMCNKKKDEIHFHNYVQIWYILAGTLSHSVGDSEYLQTPGSCIIVLPYTEHAINTLDAEDTPVALSISVTDEFFRKNGSDAFMRSGKFAHFDGYSIPEFFILEDSEKEIADKLARDMLSEISSNSRPDYVKLYRYLYKFIKLFCLSPAEKKDLTLAKEHALAIDRAVCYIADHAYKKVMRKDLCSVAAMSRTVFSRVFKEITGTTTKEMLLGIKFRRAQYLLQYTDNTLNEIAYEVGLYDKSRLAHLFTKALGMSPIQFRHETRPYALESDKQSRRRMKFYPKLTPDKDSK